MNDFHKLVVIIVSLADSDCKQLMGLAVFTRDAKFILIEEQHSACKCYFASSKVNASPDPKTTQNMSCIIKQKNTQLLDFIFLSFKFLAKSKW